MEDIYPLWGFDRGQGWGVEDVPPICGCIYRGQGGPYRPEACSFLSLCCVGVSVLFSVSDLDNSLVAWQPIPASQHGIPVTWHSISWQILVPAYLSMEYLYQVQTEKIACTILYMLQCSDMPCVNKDYIYFCFICLLRVTWFKIRE